MLEIRAASIKYDDGDEHILRRIAGAVIYHWDDLPEPVCQLILEQSPYVLDRHETVQLAQQIKSFIETRKGGKK